MKPICSLGHCECDGHTVHKLSQRLLTAEYLAPQKSEYSWMHSKVPSDWLPSYVKATRQVLEILKMARYFPDSPPVRNQALQCQNPEDHTMNLYNLENVRPHTAKE